MSALKEFMMLQTIEERKKKHLERLEAGGEPIVKALYSKGYSKLNKKYKSN